MPPPAPTCPKDRRASLRTDAEYPCTKTCKFWQVLDFKRMCIELVLSGALWLKHHAIICYLFLLLYRTPSANVMSLMHMHLLNTIKRCPPPPLAGPPEKNDAKRMPRTAWTSSAKLSNPALTCSFCSRS